MKNCSIHSLIKLQSVHFAFHFNPKSAIRNYLKQSAIRSISHSTSIRNPKSAIRNYLSRLPYLSDKLFHFLRIFARRPAGNP
jgi:hypothetical protein